MQGARGCRWGAVALPGSTVDVEALVAEVEILRERLPVGRPVLVFDRGMVSEKQLRDLALDGWKYIAAARLRTKLARAALARPGRYLKISGGTVRLDETRVKADARYDGKWVVRTNTALPPQEIAQRYKGLWRIERAFRTLKSPLEIHPLYHWTERRVRAHVGVCVLAYGMLRVVERLVEKAGLPMSGQEALRKLERMTVDDANVGGLGLRVRSDLTPEQKSIFEALRTTPPPRVEPLVANLLPAGP